MTLLEKYLEKGELSSEEIIKGLDKVLHNGLHSCFCCRRCDMILASRPF